MSLMMEQLVAQVWDGYFPIDLNRAAKALGAKIVTDSALDPQSQVALEDEVPVIRLRPEGRGSMRRFAAAHCLGHIALGHLRNHDVLADPVRSDHFTTNTGKSLELQANRYALALLMPEDALYTAIGSVYRLDGKRIRINTIANISKLFRVSEAAVAERLSRLEERRRAQVARVPPRSQHRAAQENSLFSTKSIIEHTIAGAIGVAIASLLG